MSIRDLVEANLAANDVLRYSDGAAETVLGFDAGTMIVRSARSGRGIYFFLYRAGILAARIMYRDLAEDAMPAAIADLVAGRRASLPQEVSEALVAAETAVDAWGGTLGALDFACPAIEFARLESDGDDAFARLTTVNLAYEIAPSRTDDITAQHSNAVDALADLLSVGQDCRTARFTIADHGPEAEAMFVLPGTFLVPAIYVYGPRKRDVAILQEI